MTDLPISDYAFVSDCRSAALISKSGSIDWLCFPRFDGPSVFGRMLDETAGHWSIRPVADADVTRRYLAETLVLETTYRTGSGTVVVTDALAVGRNERGHELGAHAPSAMLRSVTATTGTVEMVMEFAPRPEYGLIYPVFEPVEGGVVARGGANVMALSAPVDVVVRDFVAMSSFTIASGERLGFAMHHRTTSDEPPMHWTQGEIHERLDDTVVAWQTWSSLHQNYVGPWSDLVHHSGRVLYALTYYPTGAICAAPTTSLPETPGGERNWDYRFSWVRDASFTLQALWVAACPDEATKFFDYLTSSASTQVGRGGDLQIMFGIGGEHDLTERELPHLRGWRGSAPVRVGNGAWNQRQLDVYGELLDAAALLADQLTDASAPTRQFLSSLADAAADRWHEKDQGIWEIRGEPRHFLYSKLMCWVALDRAITLADHLDGADRVARWTKIRDEIADEILHNGWSDDAGAYTQAFGSDALDASNLMLAIVGFLPATDPKMKATIDAIADRLTDKRGLVFRYVAEDGLEGEEGSFLLCTFWLAHALALAGEVDRATAVFERAIAFANDVGLLSEEIDSRTGELLGNFPQAFSHIGLVNAAWAISNAVSNASAMPATAAKAAAPAEAAHATT